MLCCLQAQKPWLHLKMTSCGSCGSRGSSTVSPLCPLRARACDIAHSSCQVPEDSGARHKNTRAWASHHSSSFVLGGREHATGQAHLQSREQPDLQRDSMCHRCHTALMDSQSLTCPSPAASCPEGLRRPAPRGGGGPAESWVRHPLARQVD